jgi:hypothetical protein
VVGALIVPEAVPPVVALPEVLPPVEGAAPVLPPLGIVPDPGATRGVPVPEVPEPDPDVLEPLDEPEATTIEPSDALGPLA